MHARLLSPALVAALAVLAAPGVAGAGRATAAPVARGVVDVNTSLGYQGASAAGTGMVLSASGVVLTNNHVIRGATAVRVTDPSSGRTYKATVAGYDVANDIAVLKVSGASGLRTIAPGNSATVKVGDRVTAVGNALGVGGAPVVARGRITALNRSVAIDDGNGNTEQLAGLIATDAALQPGDSGGPLLDAAGRAIAVDTAGTVGYASQQTVRTGLAIPINRALAIARQIVAGHATATTHVGPTAFLGVDVSFGGGPSGDVAGAVVAAVVPSSPAEQAGLTPGSVITALNGHPISSYATLSSALSRASVGSAATLAWTDPSGAAHTADVHLAPGPPL